MKVLDVLQVVNEDEISRFMVVVESCAQTDPDYEGLFVVYDPEENAGDLIALIREANSTVEDQMLALADTKPLALIETLCGTEQIYPDHTCTEMFVEKCGGKNAFVSQYLTDDLLQGLDGMQDAGEVQNLFDEVPLSVNAGVEHTNAMAAPVAAVPTMAATGVRELTESLQETVRRVEQLVSPISEASETLRVAYERMCNKEEAMSDRMRGLEGLFNPDGTFKGFTPDNIESIAQAAKSMDESINLGNLESEDILSMDEIAKATKCIEDFSANIFKQFVLNICSHAATDVDRVYVSGIIGRFLEYVKENV